MFLYCYRLFHQLSRNVVLLKPSRFSFFVFFLTSFDLITNAHAFEVKLHPSLLTAQRNYQIDASILYEVKNHDVLVPKKSFTGPIIHLSPLPKHFNAGNAPRFVFRENDDGELSYRLKKLYFAAAPNGELYPADSPNFSKANVKNDTSLSYPIPNIGRPYQKTELRNWQWYPFLIEALRLALEARDKGNHPFGAVLVENGKILVRGLNTVITEQDFTAHAERNLESLAGKLPSTVRSHAILVTSTEPCAMCAAGNVWTGIGTIVYGLSEQGLGVITKSQSFEVASRELLSHAKMSIKIVGPIFESISAMVHQGFWIKK